jgi:hypothetical protein
MPVMKGASAPPDVPIEPMKDNAGICLFRGIRRSNIWIAHGYMGPSRRPEMATATELPGIDGTNQMISSRIKAFTCQQLVSTKVSPNGIPLLSS